MTLSIDPMPPEIRVRVEQIARDAGLDVARIDEPAKTLSDAERVRVHFARAMANDPALILLEHPTAPLGGGAASAEFGRHCGGRRAMPADSASWRCQKMNRSPSASGGARLCLKPATGKIGKRGWFG